MLTAGEHTFSIAYREDGANLDKLCITNDMNAPEGIGRTADIVCLPDTVTPVSGIPDGLDGSDTYILGQNYPNPFTGNTTIGFEITRDTFVSLKVYSILGEEIAELAGKEYMLGMHTVEFDATDLSKGIYFYTMKTNQYFVSRKMSLQAE